jgi:membrane protein YqaA with SNARE-associated domain
MITLLYTILSIVSSFLTIITIVGWLLYIVLITMIVKYTYAKRHPHTAPIIVCATMGTIIGSVFNFALGLDTSMFAVTGVALALVGTVAFMRIYDKVKNKG